MFSKLAALFFASCFIAWGQVKYLPFEDEALKAIVEAANQIYSLDRIGQEALSEEKREEIDREKSVLRGEIRDIGERFGKGTLPLHAVEKPDLAKLPLTGWTEKELMAAAENGGSAACMELTFRWLSNEYNQTSWAVYSQVNKWLSLAKDKKHPGAEFLWNFLLTPIGSQNRAESGNPYRNIPGFDEFNRLLDEGDEVAYKIMMVLYAGEKISDEEWLKNAYRNLGRKAEEGDRAAQRHYVIWSCINDDYGDGCEEKAKAGHESGQEREKREMRRKWFDQLCEEGNMEARYYWLDRRPETCTADYLERIVRYAVELYNAGYAPVYDDCFFGGIFGAAFDVWDFVYIAFPLMNEGMLDHDIYKVLDARGSLEALEGGPRYDERSIQKFQEYADGCIKMGSGCLFAPFLERYHSWDRFDFFDDSPESDFLLHTTVKPLAEKGYPGAMEFMAVCYMQGLGVTRNISVAINLWEQALLFYTPLAGKSAFDFTSTLFEIRVNIERCRMKQAGEDEKVKKEIAQRLQALEREAEADASGDQRFSEAGLQTLNFLLGYIYETGYGVSVDLKKAASRYEKAPDMGEALNNLGCMYEEGLGVGENVKQAANLFQKAAARQKSSVSETARENLERLEGKANKRLTVDDD